MRYYSDACPEVTLAAAISNTDVEITTSAPVHGEFAGFPFVLRIRPGSYEELVLVTSGAGTVGNPYVVTRGWGSTVAVPHPVGATIDHAVGSTDFQDSRDHEAGTASVHGIADTALLALKPQASDKVVYVSTTGSDANDGLTWRTAKLTVAGGLAALSGGPGVVQLGAGNLATGSVIDLNGRTGVVIQGLGGATAGAAPITVVTHTGTGAAVFAMRSSIGCKLRSFMLLYNNPAFTADVIDLRSSGTSTALWEIYDLYIGGPGTGNSARSAINVGNAQDGAIRQCNIVGTQHGVLGRSVAGDYSNAIIVDRCRFSGATTASIRNIGEGWVISGCNFAAISGGKAGAILNAAGIVGRGILITGNWFGDVSAGAGGAQISMEAAGLAVVGNFIGFNTTATGVVIGDNSVGVRVNGNRFEAGNSGDTGISIGTGVTEYDVSGNQYQSVATKLAGGAGSTVAQFRHPENHTAAYRWQNSSGVDILSVNTNNGRVGILTGTPNSALHVNGPIATAYAAVTGAVTLGTSHSVVGASAASPYTITLPSAVSIGGRRYTIVKTDNNANTVTIGTTSGQTINGSTTYVGLNAQYKRIEVVSDGANWLIVHAN